MPKNPSQDVEKNRDKLLTAIYSATDAVVAEMDRRFTDAISADVWKWPRGESPRDIVDTGALRASQTYEKQADGQYQFRWSVPYAAQVHEGGTFFDGSPMPARPWTRKVLREMRDQKTIEAVMKKRLQLNTPSPSSPQG